MSAGISGGSKGVSGSSLGANKSDSPSKQIVLTTLWSGNLNSYSEI